MEAAFSRPNDSSRFPYTAPRIRWSGRVPPGVRNAFGFPGSAFAFASVMAMWQPGSPRESLRKLLGGKARGGRLQRWPLRTTLLLALLATAAFAGSSRCWNIQGGRKVIQLDTELPVTTQGGAPGVSCEWMDEELLEHACSRIGLTDEWLVGTWSTVVSVEGVRCYYEWAAVPTPTPGPGPTVPPQPRRTPLPIRMQVICTGTCR